MITEQDLKEAIAECQGARNPNASTCIKLAAFLTIQREMYGPQNDISTYSFADKPKDNVTELKDSVYYSDTEFGRILQRKKIEEILPVIDELMTTLEVVYPRLYDSVIQELN